MKPLRLAIVVQRFWPRVGSLETRAGQLACGLADFAVDVTVITARWHSHWPAEIYYHGIPVVRLDPPPRGRWSTWRWTRSLAHWLQRHAEQFDLVCVWGLMHEARAALQAVGPQLPVVLVPERTGWDGDCFRQVHVPDGRGIKRACLRAQALVASSPAARRELEAAGYPRERILDVPLGVPLSLPRTQQTQAEARVLLAESNAALQLAAQRAAGGLDESVRSRRLGATLVRLVDRGPSEARCPIVVGRRDARGGSHRKAHRSPGSRRARRPGRQVR